MFLEYHLQNLLWGEVGDGRIEMHNIQPPVYWSEQLFDSF